MNKKMIIIPVVFILILLFRFNYKKKSKTDLHSKGVSCYGMAVPETLPDIFEANPAINRSIFFHETSCRSYDKGRITLTAREACAVESAARQNPNMEIYLLFTSAAPFISGDDESDRFLKALRSYKNVNFHYINFEKYAKGTLIENLFSSKKLLKSHHPIVHASDVLRYLTLWRYGGIYLDLDVVVIKSLEKFPMNFAGYESSGVATGVLSFSSTGEGHNFSTLCLKDLHDKFDGSRWSYNSNGVLQRVMGKQCVKKTVNNVTKQHCLGNFTVHPEKWFYPISWGVWTKYFNSGSLKEVEEKSKDSYIVHLWNKLSATTKIPIKDVDVPYMAFARNYCPKVLFECDEFF